MSQENPWILVVGCGEMGAKWAAQQNGRGRYIGIDYKKVATAPRFVMGDLFSLPFKGGSIDKIHADFAINGLIDRNPNIAVVQQNPDILDTNYFPPLVRKWFRQTVHGSHGEVRKNIKEVAKYLRMSALQEMWRVLSVEGKLEVLDFDYNINNLVHFGPLWLNESPRLVATEPLAVTMEDWKRSASLQKVSGGTTHVQKISIQKLNPYQSRFVIE